MKTCGCICSSPWCVTMLTMSSPLWMNILLSVMTLLRPSLWAVVVAFADSSGEWELSLGFPYHFFAGRKPQWQGRLPLYPQPCSRPGWRNAKMASKARSAKYGSVPQSFAKVLHKPYILSSKFEDLSQWGQKWQPIPGGAPLRDKFLRGLTCLILNCLVRNTRKPPSYILIRNFLLTNVFALCIVFKPPVSILLIYVYKTQHVRVCEWRAKVKRAHSYFILSGKSSQDSCQQT